MDTKRLLQEILTVPDFPQPGLEPYKLYAWMSTHFNGVTIFDVGTFRGYSAQALAYNKNNKVISYDICHTNPIHVDNVVYKVGAKLNLQ